ncbi:MAG: orotidine-5'-phosphate decarboxylase [Phycisphaerae bacterium]
MTALAKLHSSIAARRSQVCCGLDPDPTLMPLEYRSRPASLAENVATFLIEAADIAAPNTCAWKLQKAFYDLIPSGDEVLAKVIDHIKTNYPDTVTIVDCKAGDVRHTMSAYVSNALERFGADALVVNPFMGDDVLSPFASRPDKLGVVLVRTSNPGAAVIQDAPLADGRPLWQHVLDLVFDRWNSAGNLLPVLSCQVAGSPCVRALVPKDTPIFIAGFGAQGGTVQDLEPILQSELEVLVNASRSLLYPYSPADRDWRQAIHQAVVQMNTALNTLKGLK